MRSSAKMQEIPEKGRINGRSQRQRTAGFAAPRIGVVSEFDVDKQVYFCPPNYVHAVDVAGGLPILLSYLESAAHVMQILSMLDGVILSGGGDLDPSLYGEPMQFAEGVISQRDTFELDLARAVLDSDIPVFGICRGMQMLNVAAGGSLYPDIASCIPGALNHRDAAPMARPVHPVSIENGSLVARLCGATTVNVNSRHHQAVREIARGFRVSACAPDGVIEAIELSEHRFAIGVQWHPESLWEIEPACQRLFTGFIVACASAT